MNKIKYYRVETVNIYLLMREFPRYNVFPSKKELIYITHLYDNYLKHKGDPFKIKPCQFSDDKKATLRNLYKSEKDPLKSSLHLMRYNSGLNSCPVCGSLALGEIDHYLPRSTYPEFSIFKYNLVPCCSLCNGKKGINTHNENDKSKSERFAHAIFDEFLRENVVRFQYNIVGPNIIEDLEILIVNVPVPSNPYADRVINYHIENLLLETNAIGSASIYWAKYARNPKKYFRHLNNPTFNQVKDEIKLIIDQMDYHYDSKNNWESMALLGIYHNDQMIRYLQQHL